MTKQTNLSTLLPKSTKSAGLRPFLLVCLLLLIASKPTNAQICLDPQDYFDLAIDENDNFIAPAGTTYSHYSARLSAGREDGQTCYPYYTDGRLCDWVNIQMWIYYDTKVFGLKRRQSLRHTITIENHEDLKHITCEYSNGSSNDNEREQL